MSKSFVSSIPLRQFKLWDKIQDKRTLISFDLEVTARCNNNCRHCYINLSAGDKKARNRELSLEDIKEICDEAIAMGAVWCLLTGGEPLLREDFLDIYMCLKRKGLLISVFTNANLITEEHVKLFKKYPPRDIEVSVYGITEKTYEAVTRRSGSFAAFMRGLDLLLRNDVNVRFKAMVLRSNINEFPEIARFCREKTMDYFRFDPFLHLRYDGDPERNEEIKLERLSPEEIVGLERSDPERFDTLKEVCEKRIISGSSFEKCNHIFHCGAGYGSFSLSYDGRFRLCSSLWHPDCVYGLRKGNLSDAWHNFVPMVREMGSDRKEYLEKCRVCSIVNFCMWCPALAHLETGKMDMPVDYFCKIAHARIAALKKHRH